MLTIGIDRGIGRGEVATAYTDDTNYTPPWQTPPLAVKADITLLATAREFADNARKTKGRSHDYHGRWYQPLVQHADVVIYRTILNLIMFWWYRRR